MKNVTTIEEQTATAYVKPAIEVIEMEIEGAILTGSGSDFTDGGSFGRD